MGRAKYEGWVKLHRSILAPGGTWMVLAPQHRPVFITLLLSACFAPTTATLNGAEVVLQPGQYYTSYSRLAELCGVTKGVAASAVRALKDLDFLTVESRGKSGIIITIKNWQIYQEAQPVQPKQPKVKKQPKRPAKRAKAKAETAEIAQEVTQPTYTPAMEPEEAEEVVEEETEETEEIEDSAAAALLARWGAD